MLQVLAGGLRAGLDFEEAFQAVEPLILSDSGRASIFRDEMAAFNLTISPVRRVLRTVLQAQNRIRLPPHSSSQIFSFASMLQ